MAVEFKDYYEILGVPRTASQEDIHRTFRKLALKYHPDVAKDKSSADERFKGINEANEVLSDPEKRRKYDALGANWKQGEQFHPPPNWREEFGEQSWGDDTEGDFEFHFGGTGFSDFFESLFGMHGGRTGFSHRSGFDAETLSQRGRDVEADIMVTIEEAWRGSTRGVSLRRVVPCDQCHGTGRTRDGICAKCGGRRQIAQTNTYQVRIPAGVYEGQLLRLGGQGEHGVGGGQSGDLFLRVRFAKHPDYRIERSHLYYDVDIAPWDAVLGTSLTVPLLDGSAKLRVPAGTRSGQQLRIRGKGLPQRGGGRGDLFVVVRIQVPERIDKHQRALWEQLRRESASTQKD